MPCRSQNAKLDPLVVNLPMVGEADFEPVFFWQGGQKIIMAEKVHAAGDGDDLACADFGIYLLKQSIE